MAGRCVCRVAVSCLGTSHLSMCQNQGTLVVHLFCGCPFVLSFWFPFVSNLEQVTLPKTHSEFFELPKKQLTLLNRKQSEWHSCWFPLKQTAQTPRAPLLGSRLRAARREAAQARGAPEALASAAVEITAGELGGVQLAVVQNQCYHSESTFWPFLVFQFWPIFSRGAKRLILKFWVLWATDSFWGFQGTVGCSSKGCGCQNPWDPILVGG